MKVAEIWQDGGPKDWNGVGISIAVGIVITIVSVIGILLISKWGGVEKK